MPTHWDNAPMLQGARSVAGAAARKARSAGPDRHFFVLGSWLGSSGGNGFRESGFEWQTGLFPVLLARGVNRYIGITQCRETVRRDVRILALAVCALEPPLAGPI